MSAEQKMGISSPRNNAITIVFCILVALCEGLDLQAAGVAAGGIGAEFKPTPDQFGTFFSAGTFGLFWGAVIGGKFADHAYRAVERDSKASAAWYEQ